MKNLLRKAAALALTLALIPGAAACGSKTTDETAGVSQDVQAFVQDAGDYNSSLYNISEKYGSVCIKVTQDYYEGEGCTYSVYASGDTVAVDYGEDGIQMLYGGKIYETYTNEEGQTVYGVYATYREDSVTTKEDFAQIGVEFSLENDYDISLVKEEDGSYTWTSSYACATNVSEDGYATSTLKLNADYEVTAVQTIFYNEDSSVYCKEIDEYMPGADCTELFARLTDALNGNEGKTRKITFHEVKDGKETGEPWTLEVPYGFECEMTFPDAYYGEDGTVSLFTDDALTQKLSKADLTADVDYYIQAQ